MATLRITPEMFDEIRAHLLSESPNEVAALSPGRNV